MQNKIKFPGIKNLYTTPYIYIYPQNTTITPGVNWFVLDEQVCKSHKPCHLPTPHLPPARHRSLLHCVVLRVSDFVILFVYLNHFFNYFFIIYLLFLCVSNFKQLFYFVIWIIYLLSIYYSKEYFVTTFTPITNTHFHPSKPLSSFSSTHYHHSHPQTQNHHRYEVTSTKYTRDLFKELFVAFVASLFMAFGVLFLLLWVGIYVWWWEK